MKKQNLLSIIVCVLFISGAVLVGCGNKNAQPQQESETQTMATPTEESSCLDAVEDYLVNEIGKQYAPGEICIPYLFVVHTDESNADDIRIWGDFWVFNYNLSGDTLKTVSGGSHPGLMHVRNTEAGYKVTAFDAVEDGTNNLPSAKRIFGEYYDAFHAINSDDKKRNENMLRITSDYVKKNHLKATMVQDYGWPAKKLLN